MTAPTEQGTPRTDAVFHSSAPIGDVFDLARQLERELATAQAEVEEIKTGLRAALTGRSDG